MNIRLDYFILAVLILYIPFHLLEEALGNFPLWMKDHGYTPVKKSYGFWMAGNIFFFYPLLVLSALLYHFDNKTFLFAGFSVLLWGIFNFLEHLFFTIKDAKVSPGLYTGILYAVIGGAGIYKLYQEGLLTFMMFFIAVIVALINIITPGVILQKYIGNKLWKDFF